MNGETKTGKNAKTNVIEEIQDLEEQLRQAELGPDPEFFQKVLADSVLLDGQITKAKVVEAHRPGKGPKFTKVDMTDFQIIDHGTAAVVTCTGLYESPQWYGWDGRDFDSFPKYVLALTFRQCGSVCRFRQKQCYESAKAVARFPKASFVQSNCMRAVLKVTLKQSPR